MRLTLPRRGQYTGRLAFDPDTGFHTDPAGRRVVTQDSGQTWRYATRASMSHYARYHQRFVTVDSTGNAAEPEPHHYRVQHPHDKHCAGLIFHTDADGPVQTGHTDAWKDHA